MNSKLSVRAAMPSDLVDIIALLADDKLGKEREDPSLPLHRQYLEAFAAIESDSNQVLAVAVKSDSLADCLQLSIVPGLSRLGMWRGQIEGVRVSSAHRGRGVECILLEWTIAACDECE